MGNCLVLRHKAGMINLMMDDGKILHFPSPLKVHQALSKFPGHAIADTLPVAQHLHPEADMLRGNLYYLLPQPPQLSAVVEAKHRQADVVRIKLVVSKQELKELLSGGAVTIDHMMSQLVQGERNKDGGGGCGDGDKDAGRSWKPTLESIPEANGL